MTDPIPISTVQLGPEEEQLVLEVLRSGRLAQGPMVERLEAAFCSMAGSSHAVAVSSGTTALVAAIEALELAPGDEVITSPFTFVATLNAILEAGATARFGDIGEDFTLDATALGPVIGERTRAVMPVHLYGLPADLDAIAAAAEGAVIIEDAAQAHGAAIGGRPVGTWGMACFSLYATKNVTTGEGGVVTTDDDRWADRLRLLRNQGMRARYQYEVPGHNYRMTELQAAVGIPQMARLRDRNQARAANAAELRRLLDGTPGLVLPAEVPGRTHVWHQFTVRVAPSARLTRDELADALAERGVTTGAYYPRLVHDYACYQDHPQVVVDPTPNAARIAGEVLSLPVHPLLGPSDLDRIASAVREALGD